jgi:hypothetical protein
MFLSQQCQRHFIPKSSGQLLQFSSQSIFQLPQFGLVTVLQFLLHCQFSQFNVQSSHCSQLSVFMKPFQQSLFGLISLQFTSHNQSLPF